MSWKTRWETGWETRSTKYEGKHANRSSLIVILSSLSWFCWRQEWKCLRSVLFERLLLVLDFFASSSSLYSHYSSSGARKSDNCLASMRYLSWERGYFFLSFSCFTCIRLPVIRWKWWGVTLLPSPFSAVSFNVFESHSLTQSFEFHSSSSFQCDLKKEKETVIISRKQTDKTLSVS